jgi:hypothetical protein
MSVSRSLDSKIVESAWFPLLATSDLLAWSLYILPLAPRQGQGTCVPTRLVVTSLTRLNEGSRLKAESQRQRLCHLDLVGKADKCRVIGQEVLSSSCAPWAETDAHCRSCCCGLFEENVDRYRSMGLVSVIRRVG